MAKYRIETVIDKTTMKFRAEIFYPENSASPVFISEPIYSSHDQAEKSIVQLFSEIAKEF
jgi:hypothetical protein